MAKILLVDDEQDIRFIARKILERAGHCVIEAESGASCLERLEVCRRIKANRKTRQVPVVMFTVRAGDEDIEKSRECGAEAHIVKPFEIEELLKTVERVLNAGEKC